VIVRSFFLQKHKFYYSFEHLMKHAVEMFYLGKFNWNSFQLNLNLLLLFFIWLSFQKALCLKSLLFRILIRCISNGVVVTSSPASGVCVAFFLVQQKFFTHRIAFCSAFSGGSEGSIRAIASSVRN